MDIRRILDKHFKSEIDKFSDYKKKLPQGNDLEIPTFLKNYKNYCKKLEGLLDKYSTSKNESIKKYESRLSSEELFAKKDKVYVVSKEEMSNKHFVQAKKGFDSIKGHKDADDLSKECLSNLESLYKKGIETLDKQLFDDAAEIFRSIEGFKDAASYIDTCLANKNDYLKRDQKYTNACVSLKKKEYVQAKKGFDSIKGHKDADALSKECLTALQDLYASGLEKLNKSLFDEAAEIFKSIDGFKDASELYKKCFSSKADYERKDKIYISSLDLFKKSKIFDAYKGFKTILGHKDAQSYFDKCEGVLENKYSFGVNNYNEQKYESALNCFNELSAYKDSLDYVRKCKQQIEANITLINKKKKAKKTITIFSIVTVCLAAIIVVAFTVVIPQIKLIPIKQTYNDSIELLNSGKYEGAASGLQTINYEDSESLLKVANAGISFKEGKYNVGLENMCSAGGTTYIEYISNGGTYSKQNETMTQYSPVSEDCLKTCYTFEKWDIPSFSITVEPNKYECHLTLSAVFEETKYTITYNLNGGDNNKDNPSRYKVSDGEVTIKDPTRKGYIFDGWDDGKSVSKDYKVKDLTENLTLTAKWSAKEFNITVNPDGGTYVGLTTFKIKYGEALSLNNPTKTGYSFTGWYYNDQKLGNTWDIDSNNSNIAIIAKWDMNSYKITYELNGGTNNSSNPKSITYFDTFKLKDPTKEGNTFLGWKIDKEESYSKDVTLKNIEKDITLTAVWSVNEYKVTYDAEGTSLHNTNFYCKYGEHPSLDTPSKNGESFVAFYDGSIKYDSNYIMPARDVTFKAQFSIDVYTITYDLVGGTNDSSNPKTITYYDTVTIKSPSKEGNTFLGWKKNSESSYTINPVLQYVTSNVTLTAEWSTNTYVITLDCYGCDIDKQEVNCKYGNTPSLPTPSKPGLSFDGWYEGETKITSSWKMPARAVTVTAKWINPAINYIETTSFGDGYAVTNVKCEYTNSSLVIPSKIESKKIVGIYNRAFKNDSRFSYIELSPGMEILCDEAFYQMTNLETVVLPDSITEILNDVFYRCASLKSFKIPSSLNEIGRKCLVGCTSLESVTMKLTSMALTYFFSTSGTYTGDSSVIYFPSSLKTVNVTSGNTIYPNCFKYIPAGVTINFAENITTVGRESFAYAKQLIIPSTVVTIDEEAYFGIGNIASSITLPTGLQVINDWAFGSSAFTTIYLPSTLTHVGRAVFGGYGSTNNTLKNIYFSGTKSQWLSIAQMSGYDRFDFELNQKYKIYCSDAYYTAASYGGYWTNN